jgi:D-hydroxyproline dehydrogenase subunit beta
VQELQRPAQPFDLVVVGAGIVGLAHAVEAHLRGWNVAVIERDDEAVGASIRNFGHLCVTPQSGRALDYALFARERWLLLAAKAQFPVREIGTLVLARSELEMAVLEDFRDLRGHEQVELLDRGGVGARLTRHDPTVVGGAFLPLDLRTDPRVAVAALAAWLTAAGVPIHWRTNVIGAEPGVVKTSRGELPTDRTVVAIGHDVDRLYPQVAASVDLQRCRLQMLEVAAPQGVWIEPAVFTGTSLLRYQGFRQASGAVELETELLEKQPAVMAAAMNLMLTQRPDGDLVIGDTHHYGTTHRPFDDEDLADLVLRETARLLDVPTLHVRRRWRGVYASSSTTEFLDVPIDPSIRVVSVTSGIGMTTAHGLAHAVLDRMS